MDIKAYIHLWILHIQHHSTTPSQPLLSYAALLITFTTSTVDFENLIAMYHLTKTYSYKHAWPLTQKVRTFPRKDLGQSCLQIKFSMWWRHLWDKFTMKQPTSSWCFISRRMLLHQKHIHWQKKKTHENFLLSVMGHKRNIAYVHIDVHIFTSHFVWRAWSQ